MEHGEAARCRRHPPGAAPPAGGRRRRWVSGIGRADGHGHPPAEVVQEDSAWDVKWIQPETGSKLRRTQPFRRCAHPTGRHRLGIFSVPLPRPVLDDERHPTLDLFAALQAALEPQYRLERELGRGGMGVVFLATDTTLDRRVAIKAVHPELAAHQSIARRFLAEARTIARLRHPNIVGRPRRRQRRRPPLLRDGRGRRARACASGSPASGGSIRRRSARIVADVAAALDAAGRAGRGAPGREAGERAARRGHRPRDAGRLRHRPGHGGRERRIAAPGRAWRWARRPT